MYNNQETEKEIKLIKWKNKTKNVSIIKKRKQIEFKERKIEETVKCCKKKEVRVETRGERQV